MLYDTLVTQEDYLHETGTNLDEELKSMVSYDGADSPAPLFLYQVEEWCKEYLLANYFSSVDDEKAHQLKYFKKGVIHQVTYVLKNGSLNYESGFNPETFQVITKQVVNSFAMCEDAKKCFRIAGLMNYYSC